MPKRSNRAALFISEEERSLLESLSRSRTASKREVSRATVLLLYGSGIEISTAASRAGTSRPSAYKCIDKALAMGVSAGLKDTPHSPGNAEITLEAKAWVTSLACRKPKDLGFAAEVWSRQTLADYVRAHAETAGHPSLKKAAKATVQRILKENTLQPQNIKYYLEKRDPDFDDKMREVLIVYREVMLQNEQGRPEDLSVITVCVDEKPGVQAIANTAPDLAPVPGKHSSTGRDHEYKRHGTASILAGIDLHDGHVFAQVQRRHRSIEFIELLKEIDRYYPADKQIRIILDNHSSHISKETRAYLATRPGRFIYVHTPKHGSWLNLAETLFGKMARTFLKHIRVKDWNELKQRILKGVDEFNQNPVVHRWKKFDFVKNNT